MKKTIHITKLLTLAFLLGQQLVAQTPKPALVTRTIGSGSESIWALATDPRGNIFYSGNFDGPITVEGIKLQAKRPEATFICKRSHNGGTNWAMMLESNSNNQFSLAPHVISLAADKDGSLFFTLQSLGDTLYLGSNTVKLYARGGLSTLLGKVDSLGNLLWTKEIYDAVGTTKGAASNIKVATDEVGNFYLVGVFFYGNISLDTIQLAPIGGKNGQLIAKGDANGNFIWAKSFGCKADEGQFFEMAINAQNEVFISGGWNGDTLFMEGLTVVNPFPGGLDVMDRYIAKFNSSGKVLWLVREGGTDKDEPSVMVPNATGGVACLSTIGSNVSVEIGKEQKITVPGPNLLFTRYDALGGLKSHTTYPLGSQYPAMYYFMFGDGRDLYMGFSFSYPTYTIGGTTLINAGGNNGTSDLGVAKLDSTGKVIWATNFGGTDTEYYGVATYSAKHGFLFGGMTLSEQFILGKDTFKNSGTLTNDGFIASIRGGNVSAVIRPEVSIGLYPNPAKDLLNLDLGNLTSRTAEINVIATSGKVVMRTSLDLTVNPQLNIKNLTPGIYVLEVKIGNDYAVQKFIKE